MRSLVLSLTSRILMPLLLMFSLLLLLRGHHEPGGGFVGGLVAAASFILLAFAEGLEPARRTLRFGTMQLVGAGLLVALTAGLAGWAVGDPFLTGLWGSVKLPVLGTPGTPVLFDIGVYLVVLGTVTGVIFELMEEEQ